MNNNYLDSGSAERSTTTKTNKDEILDNLETNEPNTESTVAKAKFQVPLASEYGATHLNHKRRTNAEPSVGAGMRAEYIGATRKFAINKSGTNRLINQGKNFNLTDTFNEKGIASSHLHFAQTGEEDRHIRIVSSPDDLTNRAVKYDNYEYFLRNTKKIKANYSY